MTALDDFLAACASEIERRLPHATTSAVELREGHAALTAALAHSAPIVAEVTTVPVVACLAQAESSPLVDALHAAADEVPWASSFRLDDDGDTAALAQLHQLRDLGGIACGLMLIAPDGTYPLHSHPPQELYLPIAGGGQWRFGGNDDFRRLGPDELVYNHPNDRHGVIADATPLVALYVLWGDGVDLT